MCRYEDKRWGAFVWIKWLHKTEIRAWKCVNEAQTYTNIIYLLWLLTPCKNISMYTSMHMTVGLHRLHTCTYSRSCLAFSLWRIYHKVTSSWQIRGLVCAYVCLYMCWCILYLQQRLCQAGSILPQTKALLLNWAVVNWYPVSSLALDLVWGLGKGFLVVQVSDVVSHLHTLWQVCSPLVQSSPLHVCILPGCRDKSLPPLKWPSV